MESFVEPPRDPRSRHHGLGRLKEGGRRLCEGLEVRTWWEPHGENEKLIARVSDGAEATYSFKLWVPEIPGGNFQNNNNSAVGSIAERRPQLSCQGIVSFVTYAI